MRQSTVTACALVSVEYEAMEWACGTLMGGNGDGTINPTGNSRRCEFATMIMRFIEDVAVR